MMIVLSNDQDKFFESGAELESLSLHQRFMSSYKKFLLFFALALVSVLIPVFHFFLVPLFLFLSLYVAIKSYSTNMRLIITGAPACFVCQGNMAKTYLLNSDRRLSCEKCQAQYLVRPK